MKASNRYPLLAVQGSAAMNAVRTCDTLGVCHQWIRKGSVWSLLLFMLAELPTFGQTGGTQPSSGGLEVSFGGGDRGCDSTRRTPYGYEMVYRVGGTYDIVVRPLPVGKRPRDMEYTGISHWTWPEGLEIEVGRSSSPEGAFQPSEELRDRLQLEYYVPVFQAMLDSAWRATGQESGIPGRPEYCFTFRVPSELDGLYLRVRVKWTNLEYGRLIGDAAAQIEAPCSERTLHHVWTSQVREAQQQAKFDRAVALADSFIDLGWRDLYGLGWARMAAKAAGRYDDAMRLLDTCFAANHTVNFALEDAPPSVPTEADRREYERQRAQLMELKSQQEQR